MFGVNNSIKDARAAKQITELNGIESNWSKAENIFDYMAENNTREFFFWAEDSSNLSNIPINVFELIFEIGKGNGEIIERTFTYQPQTIKHNHKTFHITASFNNLSQIQQRYVEVLMLD